MELLRIALLDVFRLTSALAGFWIVADFLKIRRLKYIGMPLAFEDPLLNARKWAQIGLFGLIAGIPIFLRDKLDMFAPGTPLAEWPLLFAWCFICAALVERSIRRAPRMRLAAYAYSGFMLSVFTISLIQRG